jgi:peptidyl-prolyl cis-trans isomerase C
MIRKTLAAPLSAAALLAIALLSPLAAQAQNIAIVNGKAVPKARVDALLTAGRSAPASRSRPRCRAWPRTRWCCARSSRKRPPSAASPSRPTTRHQMELARESILIRELFDDFKQEEPGHRRRGQGRVRQVQGPGHRHRVPRPPHPGREGRRGQGLIAQIKGGAKFEDLAKKSKDPGSGENGGDLDFAKPDSYVPEFGQAMTKLKKGEMTDAPVKTQFGWHIIKLEDTREAQFPTSTTSRARSSSAWNR